MRALRWLRGSIKVRAEGAGLERFLNLCRREGDIWDIRREGDTALTCRLRPGTLRILRLQRRRHGCRVRVLEKSGGPFALLWLRRRWTLPAAACLWLLFLAFAATRVWSVSVEGCRTLPQQTVLDLAQAAGFRIGGPRMSRAETEQLRHSVLENCHRLSFFTVNYTGSHAAIQVRERDDREPDPDALAPCDLIAGKTGIVRQIFVTEGTPCVKEGDTVLPDTLLAQGVRTSAFGEQTAVHARAEVTLRTWHRVELRLPDSFRAPVPTGRSVTRRSLILGKTAIRLYLIEKEPFLCYDKQIEEDRLELGRGYWLPVYLRTETVRQLESRTLPVDPDKAAAILEQRCRELLLAEPGRQIVTASFELRQESGALVGILKAECIEPAGTEVPVSAGKEE